MAQSAFVWGKGGAKLTPEEIARQREIEDRLVQQGIDTSPVGHWTQGLARVANAMAGAFRRGQLDDAAAENAAYNAAQTKSWFGGSDFPTAPTAQAQIAATNPAPASAPAGGGLMGDFMAPIRETVKNPYALAAIASTGNAESGFDPDKANARWADPSQSGQPGTAGGVMSWRNDRLKALEAFAQANGEDPSNISAATQAKFFLQEDPNLVAGLNNAKSLEEAQSLMDNAWKYAGYDQPSKERANRLASARSYLSAFQPTETASLDPAAGASAAGVPAAGQGSTEWLRYANSGATRSQPVNDKLSSALSFLPDMGVSMEVFSGGQPGIGEGGARTGSTRHDHGGAADVFFYKDGRKLDWANPEDQPIFAQIVQRAKANGVTGFGAGDGYMQPGSMHIGFGNPAVWGAGGKGENAAPWLRTAYNAAQAVPSAAGAIDAQMRPVPPLPPPVDVATPPAQPVNEAQLLAQAIRARGGNPNAGILPVIAGEPGQAGMAATGPNMQALMGAMADPRLTEGNKRIAEILIRQQMEQQQAARELAAQQAAKQAEWARQDARYKVEDGRAERDFGLKREEFDFRKGEAARTSDIKEYEFAKEQGFQGTFADYQRDMKRAAAASTSVNVGGGSDKQVFDEMKASADAARSAATGLASLREARNAIQGGAILGAGADTRLGLQKLAINLGLANPEAVQNTETFRAAIAPQVAALMKATVGSTQISNADREFAEKAAGGSITLEPGTITRLLDIMERAGTTVVQQHTDRLNSVYPQGGSFERERALFGVRPPEAQAPPQTQPGKRLRFNPTTGDFE